jgi:putative DNA primase/helicase
MRVGNLSFTEQGRNQPRFNAIYDGIAKLGLWGFPISNDGTKQPCLKWKNFQDRPPSPDELADWRKKYRYAGVGIPTGIATGILVIDPDYDNAISYLESRGIPKTWTVRTRRGRHYYFIHPDFVVTNSAGRIADHVDVRGRGGFVVAPGSLGKDGFIYEWEPGFSPDDVTLADLPDWLLDLLRPKHQPERPPVKPRKFTGTTTAYARKALEGELARLSNAADGTRNDTAAKVAFNLGNLVAGGELHDGVVRIALYQIADAWPNATKTRNTIDRGLEAGKAHPRCRPKSHELHVVRDTATSELEEIRPPGFSDDALAAAFAERFESTLRYVAKWGHWFEYDGSRWVEDDTLRAFDLSRTICRKMANKVADDRKNLAMAIASAKTVAAVERLARSDRRLVGTIDQWDADLMLLNTPGGTIDLKTGQIRKHRLGDYCTKITAVAPAPFADCPQWLHFLDRIFVGDNNLIAYVKRLAGYMLTGTTIEQQFCFFFGVGANGKGVLVITLTGILGTYAKATASETFMASKVERHLTEVADLRGARMVVASETETGRRWAESRLKEITGATPISARFMRQDLFEYIPQLKLIIAGNHRPHLSAVDEAIRRRLHLVPFTVVIPEKERDLQLGQKLKDEWPAILRWAIDGCLEWQAKGLNPPPAVREATDAYFENEDTLGEWIVAACDQGANHQVRLKDLFPSWKAFAEAADDFAGTKRSFADALEARGFRRHKIGHAGDKGFLGLKLKDIPA